MKWFRLEHSRFAYWADFVLYAFAVMMLAAFVTFHSPRVSWLTAIAFTGVGLVGWSLVEYLMHRFVLHSIGPFKDWHEQHHQRPMALIATPTWISAILIGGFLFMPLALFANSWIASATTFGFLCGYLGYTLTHHAAHHWRAWSHRGEQRKRRHSRHHNRDAQTDFGVTNSFWDWVFRSH